MSTRKQQVLQMLANGYNRNQIAAELHISLETVKTHLREARWEMRALTTTQAVANAIREGVVR